MLTTYSKYLSQRWKFCQRFFSGEGFVRDFSPTHPQIKLMSTASRDWILSNNPVSQLSIEFGFYCVSPFEYISDNLTYIGLLSKRCHISQFANAHETCISRNPTTPINRLHSEYLYFIDAKVLRWQRAFLPRRSNIADDASQSPPVEPDTGYNLLCKLVVPFALQKMRNENSALSRSFHYLNQTHERFRKSVDFFPNHEELMLQSIVSKHLYTAPLCLCISGTLLLHELCE